jgi:hypothetical protein
MATTNERIAAMTLTTVYPLYRAKLERKGVDPNLTDSAILWLTQSRDSDLHKWLADRLTFEQIFDSVQLHPNAALIKGVICGWRVEEIENPLSQKVRYLDKLIDELAKGRSIERVLRTA